MPNTYELAHIGIDVSRGTPVITVTGQVFVSETNSKMMVARTITPAGAALTRANDVITDALAYLSAQFGVVITLPPVP